MIDGSKQPGQKRSQSRASCSGFTLIELMIVLVIVGVLLTIALPSFSNLRLSTKLKSYATELVTSAYLARSEAIKRNTTVKLCVANSDGTACGTGDWAQGWIVIADPNEVIKYQQALTTGYTFTGTGGDELTFFPSGVASTASVMSLCRQTPTVGYKEKRVSILPTGRPRVETLTTGLCP